MKITEDEVRQIASLGRLALSAQEVGQMARELDAVLFYMEKLAAVDVTGVVPMRHVSLDAMPLREDTPGPQLTVEQALSGAPERADDCFAVPRVIPQGPGKTKEFPG